MVFSTLSISVNFVFDCSATKSINIIQFKQYKDAASLGKVGLP